MNEFATALNKYIDENNVMLKEIAIMTKMDPARLSRFKTGKVYPTKAVIEQINKKLGTNFPYEVRRCEICGADISDSSRTRKACVKCAKEKKYLSKVSVTKRDKPKIRVQGEAPPPPKPKGYDLPCKVGDRIKYTERASRGDVYEVKRANEKSYVLDRGTVVAITQGGILVEGTYKTGIPAREFINFGDLRCGAVVIGGA